MSADRVPPQSLESERALLGALLLKPDAIHDVLDTIYPQSFYAEKHRLRFGAMSELAQRSEPIDLLSLSERNVRYYMLEKKKQMMNLKKETPAERILNTLKKCSYNIGSNIFIMQ